MLRRALVVEDNAALRKVYVAVLAKEGYHVQFASDGEDALRMATESPRDLVLLDVMMPVLDGLGFLRAFDITNKHPNTKVIMLAIVTRRR